jgi:hypothetical protein
MMLTVEYRKKPLPMEEEKDGPSLVLTPAVVRTIDRLLPKRIGNVSHENVLYIAGVIEPSRRLGVAVIAPKAETGRGHYHTDRASHAEVLDVLGDLGLVVVAQVHCHPGQAVYHSDADDDLAFVRAEGHWSIVVPYYGQKGMQPLRHCGFHRFSKGQFVLLSEDAVSQRILVLPEAVELNRGQ